MSPEPPTVPLEPPAPPPPPYPLRPPLARLFRPSLDVLRSGWAWAAIHAGVVLAIVYLLNLVLAWLQNDATPRAIELGGQAIENPLGLPGVPQAALFSMMFWHGVSFDVNIALPQTELPFGSSIEVGLTATAMLGLAVAGYLLFRAGRSFAARSEVRGWANGVRGLQIAAFYGLFVFALSFFTRLDIPLGQFLPAPGEGPQSASVHPSLIGAFWMPFVLASFAAGAGALWGRIWPRERLARLAVAGVSGGWRAAWIAVALSSISFLIVAALNPDVTRAFLEILPGGLQRLALIVGTLLILPNVGTGIAAAAMGGSINFAAANDACAVISYLKFPGGLAQFTPGGGVPETTCDLPFALGPAPFQFMLFLLVPLAATIVGGWLAAQRSGARDAEEGAIAGAAIAIPYALWLWLLGLMARLGYVAAVGIEIRVWVGPGLVSTILVALVWGVAGGAIGGALGARNASGPEMDSGPPANSVSG